MRFGAGSLYVPSEQNTSTYDINNKSTGVALFHTPCTAVRIGGNLGKGKQRGTFAIVAEQAGISAGEGGVLPRAMVDEFYTLIGDRRCYVDGYGLAYHRPSVAKSAIVNLVKYA